MSQNSAKLRAWWSRRQGLDGSLAGASPAEVLQRAGWARSVAGAGPYLTFFSRAGLRREAVDSALARAEIHELPSARGCTYVLPAADYALGLKVGEPMAGDEMKVARKLGVTDAEIAKLCKAVEKALGPGPLGTDEIRDQVGAASRSLGPEGAKKGITTTLPVALGLMQSEGAIRRIPINGRLDQQRYRYALWAPNPLAGSKITVPEAFVELARRYFAWIGPATLKEFQWFSGLGVKDSRAATEPLALVPVEGDLLLAPADVQAWEEFEVPKKPQFVLTGSLDSINQLRCSLETLMTPEDIAAGMLLKSGTVADLPDHAIFDRGRLVGLWRFDPEPEKIVWVSFIGRDKALERAVAVTEEFVREDLGDARSFSLDSPKSRAARIDVLRKAQAH